jgi:S1-C subfamily serine protease
MRENESDGGDGLQRPDGDVSPWAPDDGTAAAFRPAASAVPQPEGGDQDTISFAMSDDERDDGQGFDAQPGYWGQPGYDQTKRGSAGYDQAERGPAGYGSQAETGERAGAGSGYGSPGGYRGEGDFWGQRGEGDFTGRWAGSGGHGGGDGFGGAGWGVPGVPPAPRRRRGGRFMVYLAVAALAAFVGAGVTVAFGGTDGSAAGVSSRDVPAPHSNAAGSGSAVLNQVAVAHKVKPGLVDIISTLKYDGETAEGTGMILSPTGLVLTNNHVIDGATSVIARLVDSGKTYQAQVVGYDDTDDVALLQLRGASGLATVNFGNSSQVSLGTAVLALGNAEGRGGATPAAGIINALDRSIQASDQGSGTTEFLYHMMQTNAAIQQGDSGGALANNAGQVIGMITAADTASPGTLGNTIGFAIPINSALTIARQIAAGQGSPTVYIGLPGFLGVEVPQSSSSSPRQQAIDEQQALGNGGNGSRQHGGNAACLVGGQPSTVPTRIAPVGTGALILGILCGTAADSGGLVPGDVITSVDAHPVTTPDSLTGITAMYHPGEVVSVDWVGIGGAKHTTSITLGNGPAR